MQRHGDENGIGRLATDQRGHVARHCARDRDLAAVLEADRQASGEIAIGHSGARPRDARRSRKAYAALLRFSGFERHAACLAAALPEELDLPPALGAEAVHLRNDCAATGTTWRKREIKHPERTGTDHVRGHPSLVACSAASHKQGVPELFDMELRALRRDRAARLGPELFLFERAFDDCLDRLSLMHQRFGRALLIGCPDPSWPERLREFVADVDVRDPGRLFAKGAGAEQLVEDAWEPQSQAYDLVVAIGTLDTVNDLPRALIALRWSMKAGALLLGAMSGGDTLPRLRSAMREADRLAGAAAPHVHPRVEASALAPLLSSAGFADPVVDIDRVSVSYASLQRLVADLRRMAATNILAQRSRTPLSRRAYAAAAQSFSASGDGERTTETFEIIHFACRSPAA